MCSDSGEGVEGGVRDDGISFLQADCRTVLRKKRFRERTYEMFISEHSRVFSPPAELVAERDAP
jgi:hypothetical protein